MFLLVRALVVRVLPSSIALFGAGVSALIAARRRRQNAEPLLNQLRRDGLAVLGQRQAARTAAAVGLERDRAIGDA